jgi:hypothetical protein
MFKKIIIAGGVLVLFMTACGSGDKKEPSAEAEKTAAPPTAVATVEKVATPAVAPTPVVEPTKDANTTGGAVKSAFQPLSLMGGPMFGSSGSSGLSMDGGSQEVAPELKAALLHEADLPPGFANLGGDMGFAADTPEGHMEMAMNMFFRGDMVTGDSAEIVMSGAMTMSGSALAEFDSGIAEMEGMNLSPEEIEQMMGESGMQGIEFKEFRFLKASGLGESGVGLHMVMDMSGYAGGAGSDMGAFENGIAMDVYMFKAGDRILMVVTMWPASDAPNVDALALAEIMDGRAQ